MIELKNINKTYEISKFNYFEALKRASLTIEDGDFIAIVGASGSGKSTLLNIIGCIDSYDKGGEYYFDGRDVGKMGDSEKAALRNTNIGFVLQDFALINDQSVAYNVSLPMLFGKTPFREIRRRTADALKRVGITDQAEKQANKLSGGQRQRVAIARAIVNSPKLLLADEPTGQLDSKTGVQIMELLRELNSDGITVVVVTHDAKVASYAKKIITVSDGVISESATALDKQNEK